MIMAKLNDAVRMATNDLIEYLNRPRFTDCLEKEGYDILMNSGMDMDAVGRFLAYSGVATTSDVASFLKRMPMSEKARKEITELEHDMEKALTLLVETCKLKAEHLLAALAYVRVPITLELYTLCYNFGIATDADYDDGKSTGIYPMNAIKTILYEDPVSPNMTEVYFKMIRSNVFRRRVMNGLWQLHP